MRILITGASGLVGSRLSEYLSSRGHVPRFGSRASKLSLHTGNDAVQIIWEEEETLYTACKGFDAVIHASVNLWRKDRQPNSSVRYTDGLTDLARALDRAEAQF